MKKVILDDSEIKVRGLTVPEIIKLRDEKLPIGRFGIDTSQMWNDIDLAEKTLNRVFETVLTAKDRNMLIQGPNSKTLEVWRAILAETYEVHAAADTKPKN